jgi:hypothetical protein
MSSYDKLIGVFDEELKARVNEIISDYAEIISKKHGIPLDLLLRDVPENYTVTVVHTRVFMTGIVGNISHKVLRLDTGILLV